MNGNQSRSCFSIKYQAKSDIVQLKSRYNILSHDDSEGEQAHSVLIYINSLNFIIIPLPPTDYLLYYTLCDISESRCTRFVVLLYCHCCCCWRCCCLQFIIKPKWVRSRLIGWKQFIYQFMSVLCSVVIMCKKLFKVSHRWQSNVARQANKLIMPMIDVSQSVCRQVSFSTKVG